MSHNHLRNKTHSFYRWLQPVYAPLFNATNRRIRFASRFYRGQRRVRQEIAALKADQQPLKVVLGAGRSQYEGWIHTDLPYLNMYDPKAWQRFFEYNSIHRILAEHVVEHITQEHFRQFLTVVRPYLTEQGRIRIAIPDGYHPNPDYIEYVRPGGSGPGCNDHKVLYTVDSLTDELKQADFDYQLLEYYDSHGGFHHYDWDVYDGPVRRIAGYMPELNYSSLFFDCWPRKSQ